MITLLESMRITNEVLKKLQPSFRARVEGWLKACRDAGLQPYVYEGLRTSKRQEELYAIGRTVQRGKPYATYARAGQSMHQYGLAIDFVHLRISKAQGLWQADWSDAAYKPYHRLAVQHGLRRLKFENPHLEDATVKDWRAAKELYTSA